MKMRIILATVLVIAGCARTVKHDSWTIVENNNSERWVVLHTDASNQKTKYIIVCNPQSPNGCFLPPGLVGKPLCGYCEVKVSSGLATGGSDILELRYGNKVSESYLIERTIIENP